MRAVWVIGMLALAGCAQSVPLSEPLPSTSFEGPVTAQQAARNFVSVVQQMEPVAESACRQRDIQQSCDFRIVIDDRPDQPPNAFQTVDPQGRPILVFTLALIGDARNADELAFVLGHEASHHIEGHIPKTKQSAQMGALIFGTLATLNGAPAATVQSAQEFGATIGARSFSREFELEADAMGTVLAWQAGYDPERGAMFFARLPDPGDKFMGSHPPNAQRIAIVRQTLLDLRGF